MGGIGRLAAVAGCALAACGEPAPGPVYGALVASPSVEPRIRLLDPAGRLYQLPARPRWVARRDATAPWAEVALPERYDGWGWDPSPVAAGSTLAVVAPGCRVERVVVAGKGEQIVRLRRGLPVPVRVEWSGTLPPPLRRLSVALERRVLPGDDLGEPGGRYLSSCGARAIDDDLPEPRDETPIDLAAPDVLLYVPEPGRYHFRWAVAARGPDLHWHAGRPDLRATVEVPEAGVAGRVTAVPPRAWIEDAARQASERIGR